MYTLGVLNCEYLLDFNNVKTENVLLNGYITMREGGEQGKWVYVWAGG